jgi:ribosome biogenesis GTPase
MKLDTLGWSGWFEAQWREQPREGCVPARVVSQQRGLLRVAGEFGEVWAEVAGRVYFAAESASDYPAVGDWVAVERRAGEDRGTIRGVLPRRSKFSRQAAGKRTEEQIVAANVDTVFLLTSLNRDLNARRIERYLALVWESGASPVVVLSKSDLCADASARVMEVERVALGVEVHAVSAVTGAGVEALAPHLRARTTVALLGSSGVGKSTLLNRLAGRDLQFVREIREGDDRGRHATTARELFRLPGGALLIDTPGLRELQLWDAGDGLSATFAEIHALAAQCRFRDCTHAEEPGCAVREAIAAGMLDEARLESLRKLEREQDFQRRKVDVAAQQAQKQKLKEIHRQIREIYKRPRGKQR